MVIRYKDICTRLMGFILQMVSFPPVDLTKSTPVAGGPERRIFLRIYFWELASRMTSSEWLHPNNVIWVKSSEWSHLNEFMNSPAEWRHLNGFIWVASSGWSHLNDFMNSPAEWLHLNDFIWMKSSEWSHLNEVIWMKSSEWLHLSDFIWMKSSDWSHLNEVIWIYELASRELAKVQRWPQEVAATLAATSCGDLLFGPNPHSNLDF